MAMAGRVDRSAALAEISKAVEDSTNGKLQKRDYVYC